ncbi:MAG TPA: ADP-ribosylglycohydrolase family protein [Pirellulales bacterium]|jgi:ADP-ribosylglycohydrolase|nr:ADP-ribosylglycohydrolase family protein [Pirellulales bacterium]
MSLSGFQGCLLGLALGAPYEGGGPERVVRRAIGKTRQGQRRWTDDTQMALELVESLLQHGRLEPDELAMRFARSYRWSRGYGPAAAQTLKQIARGVDWRKAARPTHKVLSEMGRPCALRQRACSFATSPTNWPPAIRR